MTNPAKGSIDCLYDAIIEDILKASEDDIIEDLTEITGQRPEELFTSFSQAFEKATTHVIEKKLAEMSEARKKVVTLVPKQNVSKALAPVTILTLAARNAKRPLGFSDPSVDDDLAELRSEKWDDE